MHKIGNFLTIGGLVGATIVSGAALSMSRVSAAGTASDTKTSTATVTVTESCSMTATVDTEHTATLPSGVYSGESYPNGIGQTTIKTFCNDPSGYAIYAIGFTGDKTTGKNTVLHSNTLGDDKDIVTGTAESGDTSNWAMKLSAAGSSYVPSIENGYNRFSVVPANYTKVASYNSATDATLGSSLTTTYAAYISGTQPAGTYEGKVKYTLVHPSAEGVPDADTMQNVAYWGNNVNIGEEKTVTDSRDGKTYTVTRYCTNYNGKECTESQLWMNQNLDLAIGVSGTVDLTSLNTDLNSMTDKNGNTLADYSVDGSVITWKPTAANTTIPGQATNNTLSGTPATITGTPVSGNNANLVSGWINTQIYPYQAEGGTLYMYTSGTTASDSIYATKAACEAANGAGKCDHYAAGNYYNFTAAVAMSNSTGYSTDLEVMPNSICPRGWRLPNGLTSSTGGTTADTMTDFNKIFLANGITNGSTIDNSSNWVNVGYTTNGFTDIRSLSTNAAEHKVPLYFVRSGNVNGAALNTVAANGYAWSSTVRSSVYGYFLSFYSGALYPADQNYRYYGFPVRCVAR